MPCEARQTAIILIYCPIVMDPFVMGKKNTNDIFHIFQPDLLRIEQILKDRFACENPFIDKVCGHIIFAGGKRIRPLLTVCAARLCGRSDDAAYELSVVPEYLHAASLLHDDVVDGGVLRRGKPAAHTLWGVKAVVLVGDSLYARAIEIATRFRNVPIARIIAETVALMAEGEIIQLLSSQTRGLDEKTYLDIVYRKTGALISASCAIGALLAEAGPRQVHALTEFGRLIGIAFQMVDDVLDYTSETEKLGKAVGTDMAEGKTTLPLAIAMERAETRDRERLKEILSSERITNDDLSWAQRILHQTGAIEETLTRAEAYIEDACAHLVDTFPPSGTREGLVTLARFILTRAK
ncbi:MAG: polyprenyl synthetase family protein [Deltaproteobacteria bacterium]